MNLSYLSTGIVILLILFSSCTSLSPTKFLDKFPSKTKAKFYSQTDGIKVVEDKKCKVLVEGRKYIAPIAMGLDGDMKNAAQGIDEWVKADGGNSYILKNYEWITVDDSGGATQLIVYFDTMLCQ